MKMQQHLMMFLPTRGSAFGVFTGGSLVGTLCSACAQILQSQKEKQVFSINHIVCVDSGSSKPLKSDREQWEYFTDLASRPFKGQPSAHCYSLLHTILGVKV